MRQIELLFVILLLGCSKQTGVQLPDGRQVTVAVVSFGTNHSSRNYMMGAVGDFALSHLSPENWHHIPEPCIPGADLSTQSPQLVLLVRSSIGVDPSHPGWVSATLPGSNHEVGRLMEFKSLSESLVGAHYGALVVNLFPRRSKELTFEFHDGFQHDGERRALRGIPNPAQMRGPSWKPDSLPRTQSRDGVTVTLTDLFARDVPASDIVNRPYNIPDRQTQVEAVVEDSKHRLVPVVVQRLSDPGGNALFEYVGQPYRDAASRFAGSLFEDEPSWRLDLETELPESLDPSHPNEERFVLKNLREDVRINSALLSQPIQISQQFPKLKITRLSSYTGNDSAQLQDIEVCLEHRPKGVQVTVIEARDETGRDWIPKVGELLDRGFSQGETVTGSDSFHYWFRPRAEFSPAQGEPKSLTVTLRIFRTAVFTFYPPSKFRPPARF